ncbi:EAL domain-containing protein [Massilia cavernae]|uniref:EAL domain-containing protein n=1 Tax=Massilia cavernae TaxID=2320864 RepID=UPI0015FEE50D|nr:EAL domain-containing protein [Massilia cavernae]
MNRTGWIALASALGGAAIGAPVIAALHFSGRQSLNKEMDSALSIADEVIRRTNEVSHQSVSAINKLTATPAPDPCADEHIARMREVAIGSTHLRLVGRVEGTGLVCSSLGRHMPPVPLGPVEFVTAKGARIRTSVALPLAPGVRFIVAEISGYAAVIHGSTPMDVFLDNRDVSISLVSNNTGGTVLTRGVYASSWFRALPRGGAAKTFDGQYVIGQRRSEDIDVTAVAAIPVRYLDARSNELSMKVLPVGLLAGVSLAWAVSVLIQHQGSLAAILRTSLKREEFFLVYQPVIDLRTGKCIGAEALVRWRREDGSVLMPDVFIPVAESSRQIATLTATVIDLVERELPRLLAAYPDLLIGVNLGAIDLQNKLIVDRLALLFSRTAIQPHNLMLEATERALIDFDLSSSVIRDLRAMGLMMAIDDFGTGYSSLSYLTQLAVDCVKIDKSFVDTIGSEAATSKVVYYIIEMGKSLDLKMVAEGVETEAQATFLLENGVHYAQGFLYGRPMTGADLDDYLARH